jgi:hypothetical protein
MNDKGDPVTMDDICAVCGQDNQEIMDDAYSYGDAHPDNDILICNSCVQHLFQKYVHQYGRDILDRFVQTLKQQLHDK